MCFKFLFIFLHLTSVTVLNSKIFSNFELIDDLFKISSGNYSVKKTENFQIKKEEKNDWNCVDCSSEEINGEIFQVKYLSQLKVLPGRDRMNLSGGCTCNAVKIIK